MTEPAPLAAPPPPPAAPEQLRFAEPPEPGPHPLKSRRFWLRIAPLLLVLNVPFLHFWFRGPAEITRQIPYDDQFERASLGPDWFSTGGFWRPVDGWLYSPGVKNNPLWLKASLPRDVVIEFDARADSAGGDVKAEIFGNGRDHSSGYVLVLGGWNNTISVLARLDEHGRDRKERRDFKVERNKVYHWKIERSGGRLTWSIDGARFLELEDAEPLEGSDHDRFGLGTWTSDASFDNLSIRPAP